MCSEKSPVRVVMVAELLLFLKIGVAESNGDVRIFT